MLTAAILVALFAFLNRFSGGGFGWRASWRGRPIYYAGLAAIVTLGAMFGIHGALAGLSFLLWRIPGWYGAIDAGTDEGSRLRDFAVMSARGLVAIPIFAATSPLAIIPFSLAIAACYDIAWHTIKGKDPVAHAEMAAGAVWGLTLWALLS